MKRLKSFSYAFNGLRVLLKEEHNSRIHFFAAAVAILCAIFFKLNRYEWVSVILCIGLVITVEIINTAIEAIADFISPEKHEQIKKIKDLAAAAVLVSALTAFTVGLIIFIPKIGS